MIVLTTMLAVADPMAFHAGIASPFLSVYQHVELGDSLRNKNAEVKPPT